MFPYLLPPSLPFELVLQLLMGFVFWLLLVGIGETFKDVDHDDYWVKYKEQLKKDLEEIDKQKNSKK